MTISNNGFLAVITVRSDMYPGDRRDLSARTTVSRHSYIEPEIVPIAPIEGLQLAMCISAGIAYMYADAKAYVPAGKTGTYFLRTGEHNVEINL